MNGSHFLKAWMFLVLVFGGLSIQIASSSDLKRGDNPPLLQATTLLQAPPGASMDAKSLHGKVVVLEFGATWCGPCVAAFPHLNDLADKFKDQPVQFIAITAEDKDTVTKFLAKRPIHAWIALDTNNAMNKAYNITGIPHTVILGKNGRIAAITYPMWLTEEDLHDLLMGKKIKLAEGGSLKVPAGKFVPAYIELEKQWLTNNFTTIATADENSLGQEVGDLTIASRPPGITDAMIVGFRGSVVKTLMSFNTTQFNEYLEVVASMGSTYSFDTNILKALGERIAGDYGKAPDTPEEITESWWKTNTWNGKWASQDFRGICWRKSFLRVTDIETENELDGGVFVKSLMESVPNCGVQSQSCHWKYSPSPEEVLLQDHRLWVADAYLLFEFEYQEETTAAPIVLRYYWAPSLQKWLPLWIAWCYQGIIPHPIF
jgi:thiol-disulfide isomerase/thioredoxin